jgi:hemoglobin/transferrin/lactoferrin receptor protein
MSSLLISYAMIARLILSPVETGHTVRGVVRHASGVEVSGAEVQMLGGGQLVAAVARTDDRGRFVVTVPRPGSYVLVIRTPGFSDTRTSVMVPVAEGQVLELTTGWPAIHEEVSVTADPTHAVATTRLSQPVNIIDENEIRERAKLVVTLVANEEVGLHLQRTSPVMAGIFVRGLTGNKVNVSVDGVRYSTGAQRGGVSTFLDLVDPALLDSVEVLRGPNSAQYGSDALGGSIQFLSRVPSVGLADGRRLGGLFTASGNTADRSFGSNVRGGTRVGRHEFFMDFENLTDKNYRGVSWGVDAPGRNVPLRYVTRF